MVGIGGAGMTPLAIYCVQAGYSVTGYDNNLQGPVRALLVRNGITLHEDRELPAEAERVIFSSAVAAEHPFMVQAQKRGLPYLRRGAMLAELVAAKKLLAVVGSHGKTTATGMLIDALRAQNFDFGYLLGGFYADASTPARYSESEWVIAEVDESDGTIENFSPEITLTLNLDLDHISQYPSIEDLKAAFKRLFDRTKTALLVPSMDAELVGLVQQSDCKSVLTFGPDGMYKGTVLERTANTCRFGLSGRFPQSETTVRAAGGFNDANVLAALSAAHFLSGTIGENPLIDFRGILRRQGFLYQTEDLVVIEDYAHHPTEIEALIQFALEAFPDREIVTVFQPHRYTRTRQYHKELAKVLMPSHQIFLFEVYPASEKPLPDGTAERILKELDAVREKVTFVDDLLRLGEMVHARLKGPAAILFIGAGDIDQSARAYVARLQYPGDICKQWLSYVQPLLSETTRIALEEPLANKTTLGVGGNALCYAEPVNRTDLRMLLQSAAHFGLEVFHLGRGSNLIVPDEGFDGLVIRLNHRHWREIRQLEGSGRLWCGAGVRLKELCAQTCRMGLGGFEFLEGIPGSLGGALRMNAGVMGGWMFDVVEAVELMTATGEICFVDKDSLEVEYRQCRELIDALALGAILQSPEAVETESIKAKIDQMASVRKGSQPRESSAGCTFKNPGDQSAGAIIDLSGLKGLRIGAAEVSSIHANFIINRGGATTEDVIALIREIRRIVDERHGVLLEPEVLLMGKKWSEVLSPRGEGVSLKSEP